MIQFSPIIIGPDSAIIVADGWTIVPAEIMMSPLKLHFSSQTVAPATILILKIWFVIINYLI